MSRVKQQFDMMCAIAGGKQKDYFEWQRTVSKNIKISKIKDFPKDIQHRLNSQKIKPKECYRNACNITTSIRGATYVEGYVVLHGLVMEHAWNKIGDLYVDATFEKVLNFSTEFEEYVSVFELTEQQVLTHMIETQVYGTWMGRVYESSIVK